MGAIQAYSGIFFFLLTRSHSDIGCDFDQMPFLLQLVFSNHTTAQHQTKNRMDIATKLSVSLSGVAGRFGFGVVGSEVEEKRGRMFVRVPFTSDAAEESPVI